MEKTMNNISMIAADNYQHMSAMAAEFLCQNIEQKPDLSIIVATGQSPQLTYSMIPELLAKKEISTKSIKIIKLDEWIGLKNTDEGSCEEFIQKWIIKPMNISKERYIAFDAETANPERECLRIRNVMQQSDPADIAILGIGVNGHLALNEPSDCLHPFAHVAVLAESSKNHPMAVLSGKKMSHGMTLGMSEILNSKKILMLISGESKKEIFKEFCKEKITTQLPASLLRIHPDVTCMYTKDLL